MAEEPFALSTVGPRSQDERDYDAIRATVMESARGRWFLEEYARRNRQADTALVLAAINRLENLIQLERAAQGSLAFRTVLLEMASAISEARAQATGSERSQTRASGDQSNSRAQMFAAAERLQDIAWTMRERGIDPATCQEIETLASSILAVLPPFPAEGHGRIAQSDDARVSTLTHVLQYLEQRIHTMLAASPPAPGPAAAASVHEATEHAAGRADSDRVSPSETVPAECSVDEQIAAPMSPEMPHAPVESESLVDIPRGEATEEISTSVMDVPPSFEEHAEHVVVMEAVGDLEHEPLLPSGSDGTEDGLPEPGPDIRPLLAEPPSQSVGIFEPADLSFSQELSNLLQMSFAAAEMESQPIEHVPLATIQDRGPDPGEDLAQLSISEGSREATDVRRDLEVEQPASELPSFTPAAPIMGTDASTGTCVDEKIEFASVRSEKPISIVEPNSQTDDTSFDAASGQGFDEHIPLPHSETESTAANSWSLAAAAETQSQNQAISAAPVPGELDANAEQARPQGVDTSLDHSMGEVAVIETARPALSASETLDAPNVVCLWDVTSTDPAGPVADIGPAVSTPDIETGPREPALVDTTELERRDEASQSADDLEANAQPPAPAISVIQRETVPEAITPPGAPTLEEEDFSDRTEDTDSVEPLVAPPTVAIESRTEYAPDEIERSKPPLDDVVAQHSPAAWDPSGMPASDEPPLAIEPVESMAEIIAALTLVPQQEDDGHKVTDTDKPAGSAHAASGSESEALTAAPHENTQPAAALSFEEEAVDKTSAGTVMERPEFERSTAASITRMVDHKEQGGAQAVDIPMSPPHVAAADVTQDDVLSGAWENAVSHPGAESAHQARLASNRSAEGTDSEVAAEAGIDLHLLAPDVVESAVASDDDSSLDSIQEIEQELFAPSSIEPDRVPAHELSQAKTTAELLPQPTLVEVSPTPPLRATPMPIPPPLTAPASPAPSVVSPRPIVRSMPRAAPADPLAALRAMTDDERIALFS